MTIYRRKLPHLERDGGSYFITFHTRHGLTLHDEAKSLVLDYCLYDSAKRHELESVMVMSNHVKYRHQPLSHGTGEGACATRPVTGPSHLRDSS